MIGQQIKRLLDPRSALQQFIAGLERSSSVRLHERINKFDDQVMIRQAEHVVRRLARKEL